VRIGIFTDSYLPYTSGVVRSIQTFTEELTNLGHEVYIFAPSYRNCRKESRVFRFASIPSPTNRDFTVAVPFSLSFRPTVKQLKLDLIHVHSPFLLGRLGARCARRMDVPLVFTYHTLYEQYVHYVPFARSYTQELAQKVSRDFCNICDLVIVPTGVIGDYLHEIGVRAPVKKVSTGIKIEKYQKGDPMWLRHKYNVSPEEKVLLFVGRLGQEKNIGFLMDSYKLVNKEIKNSTLVLVGGGPEKDELITKASKLGIDRKVIFTDTLSPEEVVHCYSGSDLFVFSSLTETQGIVITEAKAAGLPVVAVSAYGIAEMIENGVDGFLTGQEPVHFAEKICYLLENAEAREEMSRAAKFNAEKLSSEKCTEELLDCYLSLVEKKIR